jgi:hypothetical protein
MKIAVNTYGPWRTIEAEPLTLAAPHDRPYHFAVHGRPAQPGVAHPHWVVTNVETGMAVGAGLTRQEAIDEANRLMGEYTPGALRALVRDRRRSGHVPPPGLLEELESKSR